MPIFITPVECTQPGEHYTFVDIDADNYITDTDIVGLILEVSSPAGTKDFYGARCNGSTDDFHSYSGVNQPMRVIFVGVDANHIAEIYVGDNHSIDYYIIGYFRSDEAAFFVNSYDKSTANLNSWQDVDCSVECPSAIGIMGQIESGFTYRYCGMRQNGSTDARTDRLDYVNGYFIIGCDNGQLIEQYIDNVDCNLKIGGYIKSGSTFNINATNVSLADIGAWTDLTALASSAKGAFYEIVSTSVASLYGIRENGTSRNIQGSICYHGWYSSECDSDGLCEGIIASTVQDFYLIGYTTYEIPSPAPTRKRNIKRKLQMFY